MSEISEKSESEKIYFEERLIGIADGFMILRVV